MSDATIPTRRLWIFRLIAVVLIPLLFIFLLEGSLRLFNIGHSLRFTTPCDVEEKNYFCDNPRFIERFFPKDIARQPVSFAYPVNKRENSFRIFILGASAAQGDPEYSYGFSRILERLLQRKFPGLHFEIINTSISATNSHVVLPIAREVVQHQPDLAIVYLGNNEVVGPFGAGTIFAPIAANRALIRAGIYLKTTRIGQLIDSAAKQFKKPETPGEWRGMEMFLGNQVRFDAAELKTVYSHYQNNLIDIISSFSRQQIPVIISTVGTNLKDFPPLESQHGSGLSESDLVQWQELVDRGLKLLEAGELSRAVASLTRAEQIDADDAELQFLLGQTHLRMQNLDEAKRYFIQARDLDTLRFRADSRINTIIRQTAEQFKDRNVTLVDAADSFSRSSEQGISGNNLFYEHVHLTFHGNYLLARELAGQIVPQVAETLALAASDDRFPSEEECEKLLALGPFDQLRLSRLILGRMSAPPFIDQLWAASRLETLTEEYAQLKAELTPSTLSATDSRYRLALAVAPNDPWLRFNYGVFLQSRNNPTAAIEQFSEALNRLPQSYKIHRRLSDSYAAIGRWDYALTHYQQALRLTQVTADRTKLRLATAYAQAKLKRFDASMATYQKALEEAPESADSIYHAMGKLKISSGDLLAARDMLAKAIEHQSGQREAADLFFNYGYVLSQLQETEAAHEAYQKALTLYQAELSKAADDKSRESLLVVLGRSAFQIGEIKTGSEYLQQAIAMNPTEINHHLTLITALARRGQYAQAREFLSRAFQYMRTEQNTAALKQLEAIDFQLRQKVRQSPALGR